ncbi:fungal-specific transcription factor domain-containing protein [Aspergillus pseudoustus]|uniref:Fungal-specific transcription factor domain-containing protein n=1 Tax=Aspergillus pseudoustus TaxID=1810923 RepID=A0ABR4KH83_9EURO
MFRHFHMPSVPSGESSQSTTAERHNDRARRACERCRQMKIKCDHAATCSNCRSSFNECVYTEPRRKRKASPPVDRLQELEKRVKAMEESYQAISTTKDLRPPLGPTTQQQHSAQAGATTPLLQPRPNQRPDEGEARFGCSSGDRAFIDRLRDELGKCPGADFDSRLRLSDRPGVKLFPSAKVEPRAISLPPRERAEYLTNIALDSTVLYHVVHRPTFDSAFELLYSLDPSDYGQEEMRHIPLVYALMALGCLSEKTNNGLSDSSDDITLERTKYFITCRDIVDLNDCSDIVTLQAIFYMNLLALSTERLSLCYTCLTHALSLAIRINLQQPNTRDNLVTAEIKRRLFWSLRQLLMAVASMCGYPPPINSNEVDIEEPEDIDDTELKPTSLSTPLQDPTLIRTMSGSIGLLRLHNIMNRIVRELYPSGGVRRKTNSGPTNHLVSNQTVIELEKKLQKWAEVLLPLGLKLGQRQLAPHLEKAKYELSMSFFHVQIFLYRPFLHYFADDTETNCNTLHGFRKYASSCVDASRNLIYLAEDMHRDGLFYGTHWRTAYMICTAGLSLIYVAISSKNSDTIRSIKMDLNRAKGMLECLIPYSPHGRRIHVALTVLIAAFVKSDRGSQYQSPNGITDANMGNPVKTYAPGITEQASGNVSLGDQEYIGSGMAPETLAPSPGSFLRSTETNASQPNLSETADVNHGLRSLIPHVATTSIPTDYGDVPIQASPPGAAVRMPVSENTVPQSSKPATDAIYPAAPSQAPELRLSDQTYYLEARPFNLQRPTDGDDYQLGGDFADFNEFTEDFLNFEYLL